MPEKNEKAASKQFDKVIPIIRGWLTDDWLTFERSRARSSEFRRFVAQEIQTGALLTLVATDRYDIIFRYQPTP